jgi:hypothetical protein
MHKVSCSQELMAHTRNLSYSGDRDQEDLGSKPFRQIVLKTLSQKYSKQNRAGGVVQVVEHCRASMRP